MRARLTGRRVTGFAISVAAVLACSQSVPDTTAPTAARLAAAALPTESRGLGAGFEKVVPGLLACVANHNAISTTQVVGPAGGTIWFGTNSLVIPAGALDSNVTITARMPASGHLIVQLAPHGLQFNSDVQLSLDYSGCRWPNATGLQVDYLNDVLTKLLEVEPTIVLVDDHTVVATIRHFSLYAVARRSVYAAAE